jgi:peptide/nickel transport system permease protein
MGLGDYLARRLILLVFVLIGTSLLAFVLVRIAPADPVMMLMPPQASMADIERARERMGLNEPYHVQYFRYIRDLLRGDLGFSRHTGRTVLDEFRLRLPATVELAVLSLGLATVVGIGLGVVSALHKNRLTDHISRAISIVGIAAPAFWIGLIAIFVFYYLLGWAPPPLGRLTGPVPASITGLLLVDAVILHDWSLFADALSHLVLPVTVLAFSFLAMICRLTRGGMLEVLQQDYIKFAHSCGVRRSRVIWLYALRNAVRPVMTMLGLFLAQLMGGVVFIETVFAWPGLGRYAVQSLNVMEYAPIQGFIIFMGVVYVLANLAVDLLYAVLDPRVQY